MKRNLIFGLALVLLAWPVSSAAAQSKEEVEALLKDLLGKEPTAQARASEALVKLGPEAKESIPLLLKALKQPFDGYKAHTIALAMAGIGPEAVPALIEALKTGGKYTQPYAALGLKQIGPEAKDAVPALMEVVKKDRSQGLNLIGNSPPSPRLLAIGALGRIGPPAKAAVPVLIDALKEKDPRHPARFEAAIALGQIGPDAREAVPALVAALAEPESQSGPLCLHAATALGKIGPGAKAGVPGLAALLKDKKLGPARIVAIRALGEIGPEARASVRSLEDMLDDPSLRDAAKAALQKIQSK